MSRRLLYLGQCAGILAVAVPLLLLDLLRPYDTEGVRP